MKSRGVRILPGALPLRRLAAPAFGAILSISWVLAFPRLALAAPPPPDPAPDAAGDGPAPARPAERPEYNAVRDLLRRGDRAKALDAARAARDAFPDDVESHLLFQDAAVGQLPRALLQSEYKARSEQKKTGEATFLYARLLPPSDGEKLLSEAVKSDPKGYWALVGLAEAQARLGKAVPAETAALAALDLRQGDPGSASRAGTQCALAHRYASAEACYRKALDASPSDANARLGLAHAILRQGRADEASAALQDLRGGPRPDSRVLLLDAAIAAEKGDLPGAEKALVQATTLHPDDVDATMQLALLRLRRADAVPRPPGKPVDAKRVAAEVAQLQKAAAAFPERAEFRYALGYAREITGDTDGAIEDYREASRLDPLDGDVITAVGAILVSRGQLEDAGKEFQHALDRNPEDTGSLFQLGFILDTQGRPKDSVPLYQRILKILPADARAWHALGAALDALPGRARDALNAFQKAVDLDPGTARNFRDLGEVQYELKGFQAAEKSLAKAALMDPKDDMAWTGLARARTQLQKYKEGAEAYEKAVELRPKDKDIQILLGAYYHEFLKDYEKAIQHYDRYVALGGDAADVSDWRDEAQAELDKKK